MSSQLACRSLVNAYPAIVRRVLFTPSLRGVSNSGPSFAPTKHLTVKNHGFFQYERNISRDPSKKNPQLLGDTPARFLFRRLGHAYEIYPLIFLTGFLVLILAVTIYISFEKVRFMAVVMLQVEVWLDRSQSTAPWDWERVRNDYWKKPTLLFDRDGITHRRLEVMEQLQDEMLDAAKKRGTRN